MSERTIIVTAYTLPGKPDPSTDAAFANSDRAEGYARSLLAEGYYQYVTIASGLDLYTLARDPEPEPEPSGKSYTVEVKQETTPGCNGMYVEVTDDVTGEVTPGVRNPTVTNVAVTRAKRTAERLRQTGAEVKLLVPEGVSL